MKDAISQLQTCQIKLDSGQICRVKLEMLFTMLDGSVCNILLIQMQPPSVSFA